MKIVLRRVVDGGMIGGYWQQVELQDTEEQFITRPQYGRVRIVSCVETETHCGFGRGCFPVSTTTLLQDPLVVRASQLKQAGWEIV